MKTTRLLLVFPALLVIWATVMPHWFIERDSYRETRWGVWGAHSCPNDDDGDCQFPSFGGNETLQHMKMVGWVIMAATGAMAIGLFAAAAARRRMPWMQKLTMGGAVVGLIAATWFSKMRIPAEQITLGPNASLYIAGAVLAFAVAAASAFDGTLLDAEPPPTMDPPDPKPGGPTELAQK